jgi:hypothetical protein
VSDVGFSGEVETKLEVEGVEQPAEEERVIGMQVPVIELAPVHVDVHEMPGGAKALMIGPLMLAVPLNAEGCAEVGGKLTKTSLLQVPASALEAIRAQVPEPQNREQRRAAERAARRGR